MNACEVYDDGNIFRKILDGEIPSYKVFESASALAILDAFPMVAGHVLVLPKCRAASMLDMNEEEATQFFGCLPRIANAVKRATGASAVTVLSNCGAAAGQEIGHCHVHLLPRFEGDGLLKLPQSAAKQIDGAAAGEMAAKIKEKLAAK
eukprot:GHVT01048196.1.p2 GENE.GHVT01048196.1~~GHVT01048196.1.p2  ORF type:complete len:149 (+),score=50.92 GHVT01048196.1:139-585(+)